jgi:hypothetical protein
VTAAIEAHEAPAPEAETEPVAEAEAVRCLNCGAAIDGRFCAACGPRVVPPYPSVRQLVSRGLSSAAAHHDVTRVLWMLPVFAGIVALFYRGWRFPVSLVFATHLHAFGFAVLTLSELANVARSEVVEEIVDVSILVYLVVYAIVAFRRVFGGGLMMTIAKVAGIGVVYLITALPAFFIILLGAALS